MQKVIGLFPVPLMRITGFLQDDLVKRLLDQTSGTASIVNAGSDVLFHSKPIDPATDVLCSEVCALITPKLSDFGTHLFGEPLPWVVKEMWVNVMKAGGCQPTHNHTNSFVSGVVYLTGVHPSASLVFHKGGKGRDFTFTHKSGNTQYGPFNMERWVSPAAAAGDLLLFPSYLLHEVPRNEGEARVSLAFNAVPARLESNGYGIGFTK
jgi:Putative 2OG-Fe(II) oxygenase